MKKVFLSLATVAFVAAGTLTMTSCGSDDSTTTAPTPGGEDDTTPGDGDDTTPVGNTFVYNGETYVIDSNVFLVQGDPEKGFTLGSYQYEDGEDAPVYNVSEWIAEAAPVTAPGEQPDHFIRIYFDVEVKDNGDGKYILQSPTETENVFPYQILTVENGQILSDSGYAYGDVEVNFNAFADSEEGIDTDFNGNDAINGVQFNYNGVSNFAVWNWQNVGAAQQKSTKSKLRSQNLSMGSLKLSK